MRTFIVFLLLIMNATLSAGAEALNWKCAQSFKINTVDKIEINKQTVSCKLLDDYRNKMYLEIEILEKNTNFQPFIDNIDQLQKELTRVETDKNWKNYELSKDVAISTRTAINLSACMNPQTVKCAFAALAYISAKIDLIKTASTQKERVERLRELRLKLEKAKNTLENTTLDYDSAKVKLIQNFNESCEVVLNKCLVLQGARKGGALSKKELIWSGRIERLVL